MYTRGHTSAWGSWVALQSISDAFPTSVQAQPPSWLRQESRDHSLAFSLPRMSGFTQAQRALCWTGPWLWQFMSLSKSSGSPPWRDHREGLGLGSGKRGSFDFQLTLSLALLARSDCSGSGSNKTPWVSPEHNVCFSRVTEQPDENLAAWFG